MSKTNNTNSVNEIVEEVKEPIETVSEKTVSIEKKTVVVAAKMSAETQKMNAKQFFDTYPHDNEQVVNLIITLYGKQIKTVAQWEAFYQQMLKKKVS